MINRYTYKDTVWVDITNPTEDEIQGVSNEFNVPQKVAKELTSPSIKSRTELHKNFIYLILHFPAFRHSHSGDDGKQEIDFIIGKNFLITARYDTIDAIEKFAKVVEVNSILDHGFGESCNGVLFFGMVEEIYQALFNELEYIDSWLNKIEVGIFGGKEKEMVIALSQVSRNLLNFKKSTDFHKDVLESLDEYGMKIFDEHFSFHVRRTINECLKVQSSLKNSMEFLTELRETNNSLLSTKENEIMKTLTTMAFVTFPLTLIAGIFSMDTATKPITGMPHDFWIILGIMVGMMCIFFTFFKFKKWF